MHEKEYKKKCERYHKKRKKVADLIAQYLGYVDIICEREYILQALSPLYQDYEAEYWWFEVLQFCVTTFLVAVVTTLSSEGSASQVFIALTVATFMLLLYSNLKPFLRFSEDLLV